MASKNTIVAIYDAKLKSLAPISSQYQNVIALVSLYDYGLNSLEPYAPISVLDYQNYTAEHAVPVYFGGYGGDIPVMFVAPAAATTTLYKNLDLFNKNEPKGANPDLKSVSTTCDNNNFPEYLDTYLKSPKSGESSLSYYLSQCERYINPDVKQEQYLNASLNAITTGYESNTNSNKHLVGVLMYNQKPRGFYAVSCAKAAANILATPSLNKKCLGFYPETISNQEWNDLQNWENPSSN